MKTKKETLADKISDILTTAPDLNQDVEADDTTAAKVVDFDPEDGDSNDEELLSKFRKQNIDLLGDVDERYAGRKSSRKNLRDFNSDESESEESDNEQSQDQSDEAEFTEGESKEGSEHENESIEETDNESDDSLAEDSDQEVDSNEEPDTFKHVEDVDIPAQMKKGLCVRNQLCIWENLLEMRIQVQKCLAAANKLPQSEVYKEMKVSSQEYVNKSTEAKKSVSMLLDKLMQFQNLVLKKYPETKNLMTDKSEDKEDDEEVPSDTEEEISEEEDETVPSKKLRLVADYEKDISDHHNEYSKYRNGIIQKWHEKTRVAVLKQNTSQSVINHIEHTLSNRAKLIKRTQLKRSDYQILGEAAKEDTSTDGDNKIAEEYNTEIYDDGDFYHQLLRELIEMKSADLTDPVQLGRQWIQLQNLRSKMKRKIDTRATKGRKIRYAVHTKLVNFMAPIEEQTWKDEAKTELYNSLFGKRQVVTL